MVDDGGRILETQGKSTTSSRVESLDIWTCWEADHLKKRRLTWTVECFEFIYDLSWFHWQIKVNTNSLFHYDIRLGAVHKVCHAIFGQF